MLYPNSPPVPTPSPRPPRTRNRIAAALALALCVAAAPARQQSPPPQLSPQSFERELEAPGKLELSVKNPRGRVAVIASEEWKKVSLHAVSPGGAITEKELRAETDGGELRIEVMPAGDAGSGAGRRVESERERIDLTLRVPARARVKVETEAGAVDVSGNVAFAEVTTGTGTIRADVPTDALKYSLRWTASRPRFYSEIELPKIKERMGGVFEIAGRAGDKKAKREGRVELELSTARGVILFGVSDPASVPTDLRERALTEAARGIIRSGNESLIDAIRKTAARLVGDYTQTLPPRIKEPTFAAARGDARFAPRPGENALVSLNASVTDRHGRALGGLTEKDFQLFENGEPRPVREVRPTTAPFNLVLLLDVSGSVEERLDFIRKAALNFLSTVSPQDRVAIISFRDDIQIISDFSTDRAHLAQSVKKIQAGGPTALYDALAYTLTQTLKPLRGERTAIVILSDGDDNRSFIPFPAVLEAVIESGALVYPLYVPSGLIPSDGAAPEAAATLDPLRSRYLALTSRADQEGRQLAEVSGGVYYPVTRLDQLQKAYDDVVTQLRTSYRLTYASGATGATPPRVRVRVAREDASVRLSPAVSVGAP